MKALNEVYFGRGPVAPLQKQISIIRNKFKNGSVTSTTNLDSDIIKFNRLAENIFGFKTFSLYIQPDNSLNAYAFPVDTLLTPEEKRAIRKSIIANPNGFKYNNALTGITLIIAVNIGLLNSDSITDEEILAVVLHEIGHGFFEAVMDESCQYSTFRKIINMLSTIMVSAKDKIRKKIAVTKENIEYEIAGFGKMLGLVNLRFNELKDKFVHESNAQNMRPSRISYTNEKFADTFAAMYGYGEAAHSVDVKIYKDVFDTMRGVKTYPKIVEVFKVYKRYVNHLIEYALNIQDEHPEELARIKTTMDYLKKELSKEGLDPKIKLELTEELNKVKDLIDQYINYPKDQDSMRILRLYHTLLYKKYGGDKRETDTDNDALFDTIDNRYDDLRNSK